MVGLGVVRVGIDVCTGHDGFDPRPAVTGSPDVFCDGYPVVRVGDQWMVHTDHHSSHDGQGIGGSSTVFCNGLPVMRSLDPINCGSVVAIGSTDVFCG